MIELKNITKTYYKGTSAQINALDGVDLTVNDGELLGIIGASGSGKSTLLNIIGCLDTPDSGTYLLNGEDVRAFSQKRLAAVRNRETGFVLQDFGLMLDRTIYRNISYPLIFNSKIKSSEIKALTAKALEAVGLSARVNSK